jgi:GNAT superfamily N-acetyltransferase
MAFQPTLVLPLLVRRYIAWKERELVQECRRLRLDLGEWNRRPDPIPEIEIVPLSRCGSEHLLLRIHNETAVGSAGYAPAYFLHGIALRAAPHHDRSTIFLARRGKQYVGYCIGRVPPGGQGRINGLAVHQDFRRRGIGRALLRTSLCQMKERGMSEALLRVHPDNEAGLCFHTSEGFHSID